MRCPACRTFPVPSTELGPFAGGSTPQLAGHLVRMRGLPFSAVLAEVLHFFQGIELAAEPLRIVFTCAPDGRPSGEAFVEVASPAAQQAALQRHKQQVCTWVLGMAHGNACSIGSDAILGACWMQSWVHVGQVHMCRRTQLMQPVRSLPCSWLPSAQQAEPLPVTYHT